MAHTFLGLDGEMTSADLSAGGRLIQIGLAVGEAEEERITLDVGWQSGEFLADPRAMEVHGIPEDHILAAPRAAEVDEELHRWCLDHGGRADRRSLVPIGWNVGAFDMPFVLDALPRTYGLLSRRTVDLNAVCFTLAGAAFTEGSYPAWTGWKRMAKRAAEERLLLAGVEPAWHDAGYDALAALCSWRWLRMRLREATTPPRGASPSP